MPAKEYLDEKYNEYVKLFENSNLLARKITDKLNPLPMDIPSSITLQITGSSSSSNNEEELGLELNGNV